MAELVDAPDSKSGGVKPVRVRVSLPADKIIMKYCNQCGNDLEFKIPKGDNRNRYICTVCGYIHYENPKIVVGTVPMLGNSVMLCLRGIEPRMNFWTLPAGFLENGESMAQGAKRECEEEALITPNIQSMIAVVDVLHAEQVHVFYRATIDDDSFGAGEESLDVRLYGLDEIPWDLIAFETVKIALNAQIEKDPNDESPIYQTIQ